MSTNSPEYPPLPAAFPARLLALATLQILAHSTQFTSVRPLSLNILTHVASRYLELLGEAARANADYSGRTIINAWDLSGVLESLEGPGALSGLHNWCIDNADRLPSHPSHQNHSIPPQNSSFVHVDKLARAASNLTEFTPSAPPDPITSLSFLPLTDVEVAALDRAGESDLEDDHPSPLASSTSGSSEDDSDIDIPPIKPVSTASPFPPQLGSPSILRPSGSVQLDAAADEPASHTRWRSVHDIPPYVPAHLPPFPGLERPSPTDMAAEPVEAAEAPDAVMTDVREPTPVQDGSSAKLDPYSSAIPYCKSQLQELHGAFVAPQAPLSPTLPDEDDAEASRLRKKARTTGSLGGFLETYGYMVEEKLSTASKGEEETQLKKRNKIWHAFMAAERTEPLHDSLFGTVPVSAIRPTRWSAGWIPHPPVQDGRPLAVPELKPFGHTPLPRPATMPVPIQFPPAPLISQPHPRVPALVPRFFERIATQARADSFTLLNRLTRLGPPSALGDAGEPLPYKIKDSDHAPVPPAGPDAAGTGGAAAATLSQPKYLEWGFHWPSHDGREPLPVGRPVFDFKPPEMPPMPKTSEEKARMAQKEKEEAEAAAEAVRKAQGGGGDGGSGDGVGDEVRESSVVVVG